MTAVRFTAAELAALLEQPPPTREQTAVIEAPLAPMLVVAGAGSGKTETMASRVLWLIANRIVAPREILGLTFTRKAAHELSERIGRRLASLATAMREAGHEVPAGLERGVDDLVGQRPVVHTYNGFALDLVLEHALAIGLDPDLTMMSASASWQIAHDIVEDSYEEIGLDASAATVTAAVVALTSSLADHLIEPEQLREELERIRHHLTSIPLQAEGRRRKTPPAVTKVIAALDARLAVIPLLERFARERLDDGALDFSDQIALAARIAREVPAAQQLARTMHRVVLLDEFQDTSVAQLEMLASLFGPGHPAVAVGDPQQAIYGWRGASAASLAAFTEAFAAPGATVAQRTLSTSWRNDESVLGLANRIAAPLRAQGAGITIPELAPRPGAGEGTVRIHETADDVEEARAIAAWIRERRAEHPEQEQPTAAVLVRARRQFPVLRAELEAAGLPVEVIGLGGLLHRPEVADVRALLTCAHDPGRADALMRLLTGPRFRIGARDLMVLGRWRDRMASRRERSTDDADAVTLLDAIDDLPPIDWTDRDGHGLSDTARIRLTALQRILRDLRRSLPLPLGDLITVAARALGVDLALREQTGQSDPLAQLEELRGHAIAFERTARHGDLGAYLDLLEISDDKEAGLSIAADAGEVQDRQAVTLITMHSAKGLEWDLVAVAGLSEGSMPSYALNRARADETGRIRVRGSGWLGPLADAAVPSSLRGDAEQLPQFEWARADTQVDAEELIDAYMAEAGEDDLTEDRRLMYVAVTRAREHLLLTSAAWRQGAASARPRSRYLSEVEDLVPEPFRIREEVPEENPRDALVTTALWPPRPGDAEAARARAEQLLRDAADGPDHARETATAPQPGDAGSTAGHVPAEHDVDAPHPLEEATRRVLHDLAERSRRPAVHLPVRRSASQIVRQAGDPTGAAMDLLRPLPPRPSASARRGTAFHAWLEQRFGERTLLGLEDLEEIAAQEREDDGVVDIERMRELFLASPWADRTPIAVELPVVTTIGALSVRGVIDAVYADPEGTDGSEGVVIVDWKTGAVPTGETLRRRALQLTVYRIAWHERTGLPLERIRTAFHHVTVGRTLEITEHPDIEELASQLRGG